MRTCVGTFVLVVRLRQLAALDRWLRNHRLAAGDLDAACVNRLIAARRAERQKQMAIDRGGHGDPSSHEITSCKGITPDACRKEVNATLQSRRRPDYACPTVRASSQQETYAHRASRGASCHACRLDHLRHAPRSRIRRFDISIGHGIVLRTFTPSRGSSTHHLPRNTRKVSALCSRWPPSGVSRHPSCKWKRMSVVNAEQSRWGGGDGDQALAFCVVAAVDVAAFEDPLGAG